MIRLQAGAPVAVRDLVVIPVERVSIVGTAAAAGCWVAAGKGPVAVCVVAGPSARAYDLDGSDLSLAWLCDRVPGLARAMAVHSGQTACGTELGTRPEYRSHGALEGPVGASN